MSANNKWPDFRLASTLRSLMGSQPDEATDTRSSRQSAQKQRRDQPEQIVNDSSNSPSRDDAADAMADEDNNSIAGSEASAAGADEDFGAIEMFDSNAAPATFSSQAPVAVMSEDAPVESSTKKSKRDKKDKRDKKRKSSQEDVAAAATSPIPEEEDSSRKHRKSKRRSHKDAVIPDSQPSQDKPVERSEDTPWGQLQEEEAAAASSQSKKKRKLSDSVDGKGRKKRRSHDQESEDQDGAAAASGFLRKRKEKRGAPESAIYENEEPESDPQKSPTVEHLRRRSQSREARSRENSVPAANQMDVDQEVEDHVLANVAALAEADGDVERLAREAWNEHRNGQQALEEQQNGGQDTEMPDQYPQEPLNDSLEGIAEAEPSSAKSKKTRSSRKKAKPTYFEQDPIPDIASDEEGNRNALGELPSPSAATPKARRAKRAAKKESRGRKPKREKLSQSMRGGSADADGEFGQSSKNRLTGFTQGRFTDAELARIARAVESYRAEHEITQREVNDVSKFYCLYELTDSVVNANILVSSSTRLVEQRLEKRTPNSGLAYLPNVPIVTDRKLSILLARSFTISLLVEHGLRSRTRNWQNSFNFTGRNGLILPVLSTVTQRIFVTDTETTLCAVRIRERMHGTRTRKPASRSTLLSP